jgi:Exonuclease V - a 5' deoxyribonuclease
MDAFVTMTRKNPLIISDVKTRVSPSLPKVRNSRASEMQLSLYHQLLSNMIDGVVEMSRVHSEMTLDAERCFSDGFLAEAGMSYSDAGVATFDILLENNNLNVLLWPMLLTIEIMATRDYEIIQPARLFKRGNGNRLFY